MSTCADIVTKQLKAMGVEDFFLFTGGDHALWVSFKRAGIRQRLARSEDAAVYMADAYARLTRKPAFVYGQYGPGAANVAGSLAEPWWSSSPVVAMTSSMRRPHRNRMEYQELDQVPLFASVTKWQAEAGLPQDIPHLLRAAAVHALVGRPGPVYVGIPNDLTGAAYDGDEAVSAPLRDAPMRFPLHRPLPDPDAVERAAELLAAAERPLILAGNGVHASGAEQALTRLAERTGVPVATSLSGKGSIPESHALSAGPVGRYSRKYANQTVRDADLILAIGCRLSGLVTDSYRLVSPGCKIVQVDVDATGIGFNYPVDVGIQADVGRFLEAFDAALEEGRRVQGRADARAAWAQGIASEADGWRARFHQSPDTGESGAMRPEKLLEALQEAAPDDALLLADTGYAAAWVGALYEVPRAGTGFLRSDGSLGWAFPAALGAQLAAPERAVISVVGDGGFGYHVGELETAVRMGLPAVTIILNNQSLAFEYHIQSMLYDEPVHEVDDFADIDHAEIARSFGAQGLRATNIDELRGALRKALAERSVPTVIDAVIDKLAIAPVTRYDAIRERAL